MRPSAPVTASGGLPVRWRMRSIAGAGWGASGGFADVHVVVEDEPVGVVGDLGLVAELDWFAEPSLDDRAGVGVVQPRRVLV